jgi:hypothetical protein
MTRPATILTTFGLLGVPTIGAAQVPQDLREAMHTRLAAVWQKDTAAWSRLTAEEFTVVVPEGRLQTKQERLVALATEPHEPQRAAEAERLHVYGDAAVRRFIDGEEWILEVWARQRGAWRVVAAQVNRVKE